MLVLLSVAGVVWNILTTSLRQSIVPDRLLGRVNSAHRFVAWGALPVGALLGGFLGRSFGLRLPFLAASVVLALMGLAAAFMFVRQAAAAPTAARPAESERQLSAA
jgi:hypothetical protein